MNRTDRTVYARTLTTLAARHLFSSTPIQFESTGVVVDSKRGFVQAQRDEDKNGAIRVAYPCSSVSSFSPSTIITVGGDCSVWSTTQ